MYVNLLGPFVLSRSLIIQPKAQDDTLRPVSLLPTGTQVSSALKFEPEEEKEEVASFGGNTAKDSDNKSKQVCRSEQRLPSVLCLRAWQGCSDVQHGGSKGQTEDDQQESQNPVVECEGQQQLGVSHQQGQPVMILIERP
jgi:hypothetical protein